MHLFLSHEKGPHILFPVFVTRRCNLEKVNHVVARRSGGKCVLPTLVHVQTL